jgi:hypothetical protein
MALHRRRTGGIQWRKPVPGSGDVTLGLPEAGEAQYVPVTIVGPLSRHASTSASLQTHALSRKHRSSNNFSGVPALH